MARLHRALLAVCLLSALSALALAEPWNLPTYRICRQVRLSGVRHEVSGTTYNPVTNSLWIVTRRPPVLGEYTMTGRKLRTVQHSDLVDPEGTTPPRSTTPRLAVPIATAVRARIAAVSSLSSTPRLGYRFSLLLVPRRFPPPFPGREPSRKPDAPLGVPSRRHVATAQQQQQQQQE